MTTKTIDLTASSELRLQIENSPDKSDRHTLELIDSLQLQLSNERLEKEKLLIKVVELERRLQKLPSRTVTNEREDSGPDYTDGNKNCSTTTFSNCKIKTCKYAKILENFMKIYMDRHNNLLHYTIENIEQAKREEGANKETASEDDDHYEITFNSTAATNTIPMQIGVVPSPTSAGPGPSEMAPPRSLSNGTNETLSEEVDDPTMTSQLSIQLGTTGLEPTMNGFYNCYSNIASPKLLENFETTQTRTIDLRSNKQNPSVNRTNCQNENHLNLEERNSYLDQNLDQEGLCSHSYSQNKNSSSCSNSPQPDDSRVIDLRNEWQKYKIQETSLDVGQQNGYSSSFEVGFKRKRD